MIAPSLSTLVARLRHTASVLRKEPIRMDVAHGILEDLVDTVLKLVERSKEAEQANTLAFLDGFEIEKWAEEADKITGARRDGKHYRLVKSRGENDDHVYATIQVEDDFGVPLAQMDRPEERGIAFGDAVSALKRGKRVCRASWVERKLWLELAHPPHKAPVFVIVQARPGLGPDRMKWEPSYLDLLADDWVTLPGQVDTGEVEAR